MGEGLGSTEFDQGLDERGTTHAPILEFRV
jgi:hypothetical protein